MSVEEGEIILNEETLKEVISEPHGILAGNNIPTSPRGKVRLYAETEGSPMLGGSWDERVKQSRVSAFARSPESSSNGSQEIPKTSPNTRGRKSQRYHREQEAEREINLGRQRSIKETKLLQNHKSLGKVDGRPKAWPEANKK